MTQIILSLCLALALFSPVRAYAQDSANADLAREHFSKGDGYYEQGKFKEAQEEYRQARQLLGTYDEVVTKREPPDMQDAATSEKITPLKSAAVPETPAPAPAPAPQPKPAGPQKNQLEYIIGEGDILGVSVWQNPDLQTDAIVRPDGRISVPLIGDLQASGLSIPDLNRSIAEKFAEFIKNPQISVAIKKIGGNKIIILGEVMSPGVYSVTGSKTVMEAVGLAGGFTKDAVPSSVAVIKGGFAKPQAQRINLSKVIKGDLTQNIPLQPEDIVFVPKKFIADLNYFLNQILDPLSKGMYTAKAMQAY